mgnify:CR=1 FL=1
MTTKEVLIKVENLQKAFGGLNVLCGIDIDINRGDVVVVVGPSGSGKSTLMNMLSKEKRSIVTDIAGTTRDATDSFVENDYGKFMFIDTAGLRRKSKVDDAVEKYSVLRTDMAVERSDVCVIMIDALEGFTEQDSKVAGIAQAGDAESGKITIKKLHGGEAVTYDYSKSNIISVFSFPQNNYSDVRTLNTDLDINVVKMIKAIPPAVPLSLVLAKFNTDFGFGVGSTLYGVDVEYPTRDMGEVKTFSVKEFVKKKKQEKN